MPLAPPVLLPSLQLAARTRACGLALSGASIWLPKILEKIFVEIGPLVVLTYALKCPLGVSWPALDVKPSLPVSKRSSPLKR